MQNLCLLSHVLWPIVCSFNFSHSLRYCILCLFCLFVFGLFVPLCLVDLLPCYSVGWLSHCPIVSLSPSMEPVVLLSHSPVLSLSCCPLSHGPVVLLSLCAFNLLFHCPIDPLSRFTVALMSSCTVFLSSPCPVVACLVVRLVQGGFFHWYPPKKLKYGKLRLDESTLT